MRTLRAAVQAAVWAVVGVSTGGGTTPAQHGPVDTPAVDKYGGGCDPPELPVVEDADPAYTELVQWVLKNGGRIDGVSARRSAAGGGRALVATRDLQREEHVFSIPSHLWLSEETVVTSSAVGWLLSSDGAIRRHTRTGSGWGLVIGLDYERHNRWSQWRPYIDGLPDPTSPITWDAAALAELQSPQLVARVASLRQYIRDKYDSFFPYLSDEYPEMFPQELHTFESFTWATLTVWGRAFDLGQWNSTQTLWGLMPFADYANHEPFISNEYSIDAHEYYFAAPDAKDAGDEIFISYGDGKTTYHFALLYGFVPNHFERGDYVTLRITADAAARVRARVDASAGADLIQAALDDKSRLVAFVGSDGVVSKDYLDLINALCTGSKQSGAATLLHAVKGVLIGFPTSLPTDEARLATKGTTYDDESVALSVRVRFKRVLSILEYNLRHWEADQKWPTARADDSIVYHFADDTINLSPMEAVSEALFELTVDLPAA